MHPKYARCIADECAMWRFSAPLQTARFSPAINATATKEEDAGPRPNIPDDWKFVPFEDEMAGWLEPQESANARRRGYCGLAGKP